MRAAPGATDSRHVLPVFANRIKDLALTALNQVWAGDITYVRAVEGFLYLNLHLYSRNIVGAHSGDTLETEGCLRASEQAVAELPAGAAPIHHSDRSRQCCSHLFVGQAQACGLSTSGYKHRQSEPRFPAQRRGRSAGIG